MPCDRCGATIEPGDERAHRGQTLCEDCYMDACSPMRTCDPWAVHSAKMYEKLTERPEALTPLQKDILDLLEAHGPLEPSALQQRLGGRWTIQELERDFSSLRHMEKVRGEKQGPRVVWRLW
jgi:hypothetical protein